MLGQAVTVAVERGEVSHRSPDGRPDLANISCLVIRALPVEPGLKDELGIQILPAVHLLEVIVIDADERVLGGTAEVVGQRPRNFPRR
jgi:hypothetical protein